MFYSKVKFARKVIPEKIEIYESYNSGLVTGIQLIKPTKWVYTLWTAAGEVTPIQKLRTFSPKLTVSRTKSATR